MKKKIEISLDELAGSQLRYIRKKSGLTIQEVADAAGLHRTTVSAAESSISTCQVSTLRAITTALGVDLQITFTILVPKKKR